MNRKSFISGYSNVIIIGAGGTGSYLAQGLAKMIKGYKQDIGVLIVDPQCVEEKNCARQSYWPYEIGLPKAEALAMRLNQQYGTEFMYCQNVGEDVVSSFSSTYHRLIITCVDSVEARKPYKGKGAWLDMGNGVATGQAIFGNSDDKEALLGETLHWSESATVDRLPDPYTVVDMANLQDEPNVPSCADHPFTEQGVYANEYAAQAGLSIVYQLLINNQLITPHIYFDSTKGRMSPKFITKEIYE